MRYVLLAISFLSCAHVPEQPDIALKNAACCRMCVENGYDFGFLVKEPNECMCFAKEPPHHPTKQWEL